MVDWSKPLRTRDGYPARLLTDSLKGHDDRYAVAIYFPNQNKEVIHQNKEVIHQFYQNGRYMMEREHHYDLENVPERIKQTMWMNVYRDARLNCLHETKRLADGCADVGRIACVKIEIDCDEGEGLGEH